MSSIDTPGPPEHRRNSLLAGAVLVFFSSIAMCSYLISEWAGDAVLLFLIFSYSMMAVFGSRVSSIGVAGIFAMILSTEQKDSFTGFVEHASFFFVGAMWYAFVSLLTYSFRPFQLIQQALADCIYLTASYLRTRADFYGPVAGYQKSYDKLIKLQVEVNDAQGIVRTLLLKRRTVTGETTAKGRSLLLILLEIIDIYEQITAAHVDTDELRTRLLNTGLLASYREVIIDLADELDEVARAVALARGSFPKKNIDLAISKLKKKSLQVKESEGISVEVFTTLRSIRRNMLAISGKLHRLHRLTRLKQDGTPELDLAAFADHDSYSAEQLRSNLSRSSVIFRHAVRLTASVLAGMVVANFFPVQRSYWILFTLVVIIKPGFSLSKQRNIARLGGTILGGLFAIGVLIFIKQSLVLLLILVVAMVVTYSFSSINYTLSTVSTTLFLLIFFNFLKPGDFSFVKERITDTGIASIIALFTSYFVYPVWESNSLNVTLTALLEANLTYFDEVIKRYLGAEFELSRYKLARKKVYLHSSVVATAFQRMLSDPKSKQGNVEHIHQFVVLNHSFSSYVAALAAASEQSESIRLNEAFIGRVRSLVTKQMKAAKSSLENATQNKLTPVLSGDVTDRLDVEKASSLPAGGDNFLESQLGLIAKVSTDIVRVSATISLK